VKLQVMTTALIEGLVTGLIEVGGFTPLSGVVSLLGGEMN